MTPEDILDFWFDQHGPEDWFRKNDEFDKTITRNFRATHRAAAAGELYSWRTQPHGRVAEIIVLDQFSRNIFRGRPESFAYDPIALVLAQEAVFCGADRQVTPRQRWMLYLPYMHSESLAIHDTAVPLFKALGMDDVMDYELQHKRIIEKFGRYPHRNAALGRESTPEELAFLEQPDSSF